LDVAAAEIVHAPPAFLEPSPDASGTIRRRIVARSVELTNR